MDFLFGVLRYHDLPQVVGILAPRQVWLMNLLDSQRQLKARRDVESSYMWSLSCYQRVKRSANLQIKTYSSAEEREENYLKWVEMVF
jgi:hypothetical protein